MPKTKKSSKRTPKQSETSNLEMPSEMVGEYGRRSTRPRTAGRTSSVSRTSIKGPRGTRARKTTVSRTSGRRTGAAKAAKKNARGRATKRGAKRSR